MATTYTGQFATRFRCNVFGWKSDIPILRIKEALAEIKAVAKQEPVIAELFQTSPQNITLHLKALYAGGELAPEATCKDYLQVRFEGARQVRRNVQYYNLDAILAVAYRVRSARATSLAVGDGEVARVFAQRLCSR